MNNQARAWPFKHKTKSNNKKLWGYNVISEIPNLQYEFLVHIS
jgi:hypothetical protein